MPRITLGWTICLLAAGCWSNSPPAASRARAPRTTVISPGRNAQEQAQTALIEALPGDTIEFAPGRYEFDGTLSLDVEGVTIRGWGQHQTTLNFKHQKPGSGGDGLLVTAGHFRLVDIAIEDAAKNAVKINHAQGVTIERVRIDWAGTPSSKNGAYGLYPVLCSDVLIEQCHVSGASDAGIYVGQSKNIIVRNNRVDRNVAGIEIENSTNADVYENECTNNAGGILVFTLPDLPRKQGSECRVFNNRLVANNHPNFATPGGIVSLVPPGTGMIVLANDNTEIFENKFENNHSVNLAVVSYEVTQLPLADPRYDPYPEGVTIHHNKFVGGGDQPGGTLGLAFATLLGGQVPDIVWDGAVDPKKLVDSKPPENLQLRLSDNGDADFADLNIQNLDPLSLLGLKPHTVNREAQPYQGKRPALPEVTRPTAKPEFAEPVRREYAEKLSSYGLFQGNGSTQEPVDGVIPYDLNTPLFSDYTEKFRFIRLPVDASGKPIPAPYSATDAFEFPEGTIIAKTFAYPHDARDPAAGRRLLETRLLIHEPEGWVGITYVWNDEQTEAMLDVGGHDIEAHWIDAEGNDRSNLYMVPNTNQCKGCHRLNGQMGLLGLKARHINRDFAYARGTENQLAHLTRVGALTGAPAADEAPRLAVWNDPATGSTEQRARAWLEINCAHCHQSGAPAENTGLDLMASQTEPVKFGVNKPPVAAGRGSGGLSFDIVRGDPDASILVHRIVSTDPGVVMPELSKRLVHEEGVALVRAWIESLKGPGP